MTWSMPVTPSASEQIDPLRFDCRPSRGGFRRFGLDTFLTSTCMPYNNWCMDEATATGYRIREARKAKGMAQQELADLCGVAQSNISTYERGAHVPVPATMRRIAEALDVTVGALFFDEAAA